MGTGQELYNKAKKIIPGGTQLLSKRPEMFLPDLWPAYYSKAKGCAVWDLDGNKYLDTCYMGIGSCVLGYAFEPVDNAAKAAMDSGVMCTLNAPEEVSLAERLLDLHPWAQMVRYCKGGGEAMAMAVRIARAATGRDIVLFCGYHGWHDWYLSSNLRDANSLDTHLLAGLEPAGVPRGITGTSIPFVYNNTDEFLKLLSMYGDKAAAVVMEPIRNDQPAEGFLQTIREETKKRGIALVFDEITAGFRLTSGGSHKVFDIEPDIAVFAKAVANGYPLSVVLGRSEVMSGAQKTFISSAFFTERVSLAAADAAIDYHTEHKVWQTLIKTGERVQAGWKSAAAAAGLEIHVGGIFPLSHFSFKFDNKIDNPLTGKTYFTQEMLERGYLAAPAFYASLAHDNDVIENYLQTASDVLMKMGEIKQRGDSFALKGPVCHAGFQRLN